MLGLGTGTLSNGSSNPLAIAIYWLTWPVYLSALFFFVVYTCVQVARHVIARKPSSCVSGGERREGRRYSAAIRWFSFHDSIIATDGVSHCSALLDVYVSTILIDRDRVVYAVRPTQVTTRSVPQWVPNSYICIFRRASNKKRFSLAALFFTAVGRRFLFRRRKYYFCSSPRVYEQIPVLFLYVRRVCLTVYVLLNFTFFPRIGHITIYCRSWITIY